jgi:ribosomal protein S27E
VAEAVVNGENFKIELFVFPDGTSVEMMVFDEVRRRRASSAAKAAPAATAPPRPCAEPAPQEDLEAHRCPACGGTLVYPLDWDRAGPASWALKLRCPDCETRREVTLGRASVERFNRELYLGAQALAREADRVTRSNFKDEADRIVAALERGLILPMDF